MDLSSIIKNTEVLFEANNTDGVLHIAFAADANYIKPAGVMISSIISNNPGKNIHFHLFTTSIKEDDAFRLKALNNNFCSLYIHFFDEQIFSQLQTQKHLPVSMYYRLIIPYALHTITDRVLYLDSDMLCLGDIYLLKDLDFEDDVIAAIHDECIPLDYIHELGLKKYTPYFNSGVMYFNIPKWLSDDILKLFMDNINNRNYTFPDQDVLNIVLENKTKILSKKYNTFFKDEKSVTNDIIILHYAGNPKPWDSIDNAGITYKKYYDKSPWGDILLRAPQNYIEYRRYSKLKFSTKHILSGIYWNLRYIFSKINKK